MNDSDHPCRAETRLARPTNGVGLRYDELVRAANASVRSYRPTEAIDLSGEPDVCFIDVRDAVEVGGMVSGAIHASRGRLEAHLDPDNPRYVRALDDACELVFYCASGARSALAAQRARELGYGRVRSLDGGYDAWKDVGGPLAGFDDRRW